MKKRRKKLYKLKSHVSIVRSHLFVYLTINCVRNECTVQPAKIQIKNEHRKKSHNSITKNENNRRK